jgi:hypothetical protein
MLGITAWAVAALAIDQPPEWRLMLAVLYAVCLAGALFRVRGLGRRAAIALIGFAGVLAWWLMLAPADTRNWQADVDRTAWADIAGDNVTLHNVRNIDYRGETDYTPHWETRTYDLAQLKGIDLFITHWGSPWIAHPILSFQFADGQRVALSVEVRKEVGESYSSVLGFFRQYELIYVVADERDVIRLRTNYRQAEEVYLYRTAATPEVARAIFLDYLRSLNDLHQRPAFYNALTSNCTTNIRSHLPNDLVSRWNWRLLLNGKADEYLYQRGLLLGDLPFDVLQTRAHINDAAHAAGEAPDFSDRIRAGRPGFP